MIHTLPGKLLSTKVKVLLVGAGGTGSRVLERLVCLHLALIAKGHPAGIDVTLVDDDTVSKANVGRQAFYIGDVGRAKADVLINRANMALNGASWRSVVNRISTKDSLADFDVVIGAVDNRAARLAILRGLEAASGGVRYWLDLGNRSNDGQAILGEVTSAKLKKDNLMRLPHVGELYPDLIDPSAETDDDTPSCSLAEALEKQSLFINPTVADMAMNILWLLFTQGYIEHHGVFVNLNRMMVTPLAVDPQAWERFGVVRNGRRQKVVRPSRVKVAQ
jgi:PRTRC genetic system ThiF family protein